MSDLDHEYSTEQRISQLTQANDALEQQLAEAQKEADGMDAAATKLESALSESRERCAKLTELWSRKQIDSDNERVVLDFGTAQEIDAALLRVGGNRKLEMSKRAFEPTHRAVNENEDVEIVQPIQTMAGWVSVRARDGRNWFCAHLEPLPVKTTETQPK